MAVERMRLKHDLGVYHEAFLVRAADIESIYMNCRPAGLATFGVLGEPVGPLTTSRGRLGTKQELEVGHGILGRQKLRERRCRTMRSTPGSSRFTATSTRS